MTSSLRSLALGHSKVLKLSTKVLLDPYLQLFRGREDCFAQQGEDWYFPVPRTLDEFYVRCHLEGDATFGLYVLTGASCCHLVCIDIDIPSCQSLVQDNRGGSKSEGCSVGVDLI